MTKKKTPSPAATPAAPAFDVELTDEPYTPRDRTAVSKYAQFFETVQKNKRIKCETKKVGAIAKALETWLNKHVCEDALIRTRQVCPDGMGGIWWLGERDAAPAPKSNKTRKDPTQNIVSTSATSPWAGLK